MQQQIIYFLKKSAVHVSGEQMSEELNISRAAVWKYIDQLRQDGYEIAAVPHVGYKLESAPDRLLAHEITYQLKTKYIGQNVVVKETATSTMDEAFALGLAGCPNGTLVCAETQSLGRGRLGRKWVSPKGKGLYFSIVLRPDFALTQMPFVTLMSAVAIAQAIKDTCDIDVSIKWPNDILIGKQKISGILTEMRAEMDQVKLIVIGIGMNVNSSSSQLVDNAASLKMFTKSHVDRIVLLQNILEQIEKGYETLKKKGVKPILTEWKKRSHTLKKRVRVHQGDVVVEGVAHDLGDDGSLLIQKDNGKLYKHIAGDVEVIA